MLSKITKIMLLLFIIMSVSDATLTHTFIEAWDGFDEYKLVNRSDVILDEFYSNLYSNMTNFTRREPFIYHNNATNVTLFEDLYKGETILEFRYVGNNFSKATHTTEGSPPTAYFYKTYGRNVGTLAIFVYIIICVAGAIFLPQDTWKQYALLVFVMRHSLGVGSWAYVWIYNFPNMGEFLATIVLAIFLALKFEGKQ